MNGVREASDYKNLKRCLESNGTGESFNFSGEPTGKHKCTGARRKKVRIFQLEMVLYRSKDVVRNALLCLF
jgi:hypothetical protein